MSDEKATVRPIVYGNSSLYFKKPRASDNHTHQWTVYLRPYYKNDPILSKHLIKKVVFKLHESYPNPTRTFTEGPPYEVTETGWGEFDIIIKIYWNIEGKQNDRNPLTIYHPLKLFCANTPENEEFIKGLRPHVSEHYDEIIFNQPVVAISRLIQKLPPIPDKLVESTPKLLPYVHLPETGASELEKIKEKSDSSKILVEKDVLVKKEVHEVDESGDSNEKSGLKTSKTDKPFKSTKNRNKEKNQMKPPQKIPEISLDNKNDQHTRRKRSCTQQLKEEKPKNSSLPKDENSDAKVASVVQSSKSKKVKRESVTQTKRFD